MIGSSISLRSVLLPLAFLAFAIEVAGQGSDTTGSEEADSNDFVFRPTLGLGTGMLTFYGDVGKNHRFYHPTVSRVGFDLKLSNPLTEYLDLGFHVMRGKVAASERFPNRNLNFESTITTGGFNLSYNFDHILPEERAIDPFLSVGVESFEFLSKTDLYDENGNRYHYWSDGTIRDRPEDNADPEEAQVLTRDYTYETDLRELDLDGFGDYPERSWAFPVSIGGEMHLSDRVDMRLSTTMYFTMTDYIDNVTHESRGHRQGDPQNDKFLYSSVSFHYDLQVTPIDEEEPSEEDEVDLRMLAFDGEDYDGDGVEDFLDECPQTKEDVEVGPSGCPLDKDEDGVPDHRDEELETPEDSLRRAAPDGVALTDEDLKQRYLAYMDSTGKYTEVTDTVYSSSESEGFPDPQKKKKFATKNYMVQVAKTAEGVSDEERQRLLSLPDVKTLQKEDTTIYAVGDYSGVPDALRRKFQLEAEGMEGRIISEQGGRIRNEPVDYKELGQSEEEFAESTEEGEAGSASSSEEAVFRVQIGAFSEELSKNIFSDVSNLLVFHGDDGLVHYLTGSFDNIEKAAEHKTEVFLKGYEDAFITAYKGGKRIRLSEAGADVTGEEDISSDRRGSVEASLVSFSVQIGAFEHDVPTERLQSFMGLGEIRTIDEEGMTKYLFGDYDSEEEAEEALQEVQQRLDADDPFVIGVFKRNTISVEEAKRLMGRSE